MVILLLISFSPLGKEKPPFKDGETVCFVGNSITQIGFYHYIISLFYYTRYPDRNITFYNMGIGGDVAPGVYRRFDKITERQPSSITFMLGMNDSGYNHYFLKDDLKKNRITKGKTALFSQYMDSVIYRLHKELPTANVTLIGTSMYDETSKEKKKISFGKTATISKLVEKCRHLATENNYDFVDFNAPMLKITGRHQLQDSLFTLIPGRVHPQWNGGLVMAYEFLKNQRVNGIVSNLNLDVKSAEVVASDNCKLSNLKIADNEISFILKSYALPFPMLNKGYRDRTFMAALDYVPFEEELNREIIRVAGLKGRYKLLIDGEAVGTYNSEELSEGINLAFNKLTPQYKQSEKVLAMQEEKVEKEHIQRDIAWIYHKILKVKGLDRSTDKRRLIKTVQQEKLNMKKYQAEQAERFLENFENESVLIEEVKDIQKDIYKINKPLQHHYVLKKELIGL